MDRDRRAAFLVLKDIEENSAWSKLALSKQFESDDLAGQAFVRELVYGVLRQQKLLDYNIDLFLKKNKLKNACRIILRMGFYQLAFMNVAEHAAISETVGLAKSFIKGQEGFVNAVLRSFQRAECRIRYSEDSDIIKRYSVNYSADESLVTLWMNSYGPDKAKQLLEESIEEAELCIRTNSMKITREELFERLSSLDFQCRRGDFENAIYVRGNALLNTDLYKEGFFSVQGEASQYAVELLSPQSFETMADLCAAPGGKTAYAAELMKNKGRIYAFDLYPHRLELIKKNAKRLGLCNIECAQADSSGDFEGFSCDCVLADVPCSGLGTVRHNPEIKLKKFDDSTLLDVQRRILDNAGRIARRSILYSTCTINPAENERQVERFLAENKAWVLIKQQQFLPSKNGCDGFFTALLKKND